jgi:hypothetical protein
MKPEEMGDHIRKVVLKLIRTTRIHGKTEVLENGVLLLCFAAIALGRGHKLPDDVLRKIFEHALSHLLFDDEIQ